ncbi:hypothetical protein P7C70_g2761, partial [Phenoliferia sp. Uapishka_3]
MTTILNLPSELISNVITSALASLPSKPRDQCGRSRARRKLLLSASLVSQAWRQESQRILFLTESHLTTQEDMRAWCVIGGTFAGLSSVTVRGRGLRQEETNPSASDVKDLLKVLGAGSLRYFGIDLSLLSAENFQLPALQQLETLRLTVDNQPQDFHYPIEGRSPFRSSNSWRTPSSNIQSLIGSKLRTLRTLFLVDERNPSRDGDADITSALLIIKALAPAVSQASGMSIYVEPGFIANEEDDDIDSTRMAFGFRNLISAASETLASLELKFDHQFHHVNTILKTLPSPNALRQFIDCSVKSSGSIRQRISALPTSLNRYHLVLYDRLPHPAMELLQILLDEDATLPELQVIGCSQVRCPSDILESKLRELEGQLLKRRPGITFTYPEMDDWWEGEGINWGIRFYWK